MDHRRALAIGMAASALLVAPQAARAAETRTVAQLTRLSIEELANIEITSVSKASEPLSTAPAAIYVITRDDIRRSGAVSIPEMLRLAPNLQVAIVNASTYVISARGFSNEAANKLLVLIDGRTVYTPIYSGVFWNAQDVAPDSIERIEVVSGPGGTLWGANAVNGVINIVTRNARDTQGLSASVGGGAFEKDVAVQYGGALGENATYRIYGKGFRRGHTFTATGASAGDTWKSAQGGFRVDWARDADRVTVQGDVYDGRAPQTPTADRSISGHNLLARWNRALGGDATFQLQAYYDTTSQSIERGSANSVDTYDIEAQHGFSLGARQAIVWGAGYRIVRDHFRNAAGAAAVITPASRGQNQANVFAEDKISLTRDVTFTAGMKLEHNVYTGLEYLPSARLSWQVDDNTLLWSAVSRSVRIPARIDRDLFQPGVLIGGPGFVSEKLVAYEAGYRGQFGANASLSVSAFYNVYDDLRTIDLSPARGLPLRFANTMRGKTYGVEVWGAYALTDWWRLSAGFNLLQEEIRLKPGSLDVVGVAAAGNDPSHQFSLQSSMTLPHGVELDLRLRAIAALPAPKLPAYTELGARLGWNVTQNITLSLVGSNLLERRHREWPAGRLFGRSVYASVSWSP